MKQPTANRKNITGAMSAISVRPARQWMGSRTAKCVQQEDANVADVTDRCRLNFNGDANVCKICVSKYHRKQTARKNNITTFGDVLLDKSYAEIVENPDLRTFLAARQEAICEDIAQALIEEHGITAYLVIYVQLSRHGNDNDKVTTTVPFRSDVLTIVHESSIDTHWNTIFEQLSTRLQAVVREGSGWTVDYIIEAVLQRMYHYAGRRIFQHRRSSYGVKPS